MLSTHFLSQLLYLVPEIFILGFAIYYLTKKVTIEGILMGIGSFGAVASRILSSFFYDFYLKSGDTAHLVLFQSVVGVISFFTSIAFAIGVILLIKKVINNNKENDDLVQIGK